MVGLITFFHQAVEDLCTLEVPFSLPYHVYPLEIGNIDQDLCNDSVWIPKILGAICDDTLSNLFRQLYHLSLSFPTSVLKGIDTSFTCPLWHNSENPRVTTLRGEWISISILKSVWPTKPFSNGTPLALPLRSGQNSIDIISAHTCIFG